MPASLAERLGYSPDSRLLIVNCDDLGSSRSANVAIYDALRDGIATSATLMVPCPWARDAAAMYRGEDVGVHLTFTSEWTTYRWGPITHSPSLLDGDGGFPRTVEDVWDHADLDEVRRELRAQVERAILWGFDVSHLDSHMGTSQLNAAFFDAYLEVAVDFGLPLRMAPAAAERLIGFPYRRLAEQPDRPRTARFVCAVAVVNGDEVVYETTGVVEGEIADAPRGGAGFGYDPIFYFPAYRSTLAEVTEEKKLMVAHRGQAFRALAEWLRTL